MLSGLQYFILIWGVWILIPLVVDVFQYLIDAITVWRYRYFVKPFPQFPHTQLPKVTVIIPAYNEQVNIDRCIMSLKAQTYPHELIEIVVVNDGSTDRTEEVVNGHINGTPHWNGHIRLHNRIIPAQEFGGVMTLVQGDHKGKPYAINLGLEQSRGELIFTIDADVVLEPEVIEQGVAAFQVDRELMAATAHLIIDPHLLVSANNDGYIDLDDEDLPIPTVLSLREKLISVAQFFEYLQAFRIGRHAEAIRGGLFTLSGACAVFRREALLEINGYQDRTVSEDTDATLMLHRRGYKVGYLPQLRVHLAPVIEYKSLFAQRVRWQRGELEALAIHSDMLGMPGLLWRFTLPRRLQDDHTLALLRLIWILLLPLFPLLGYDPLVLIIAVLLMYLVYILTDFLLVSVTWPICGNSEKRLIRESIIYLPLLPIYRLFIYYFRMSGILLTLNEKPRWTILNRWPKMLFPGFANRLKGFLGMFIEVWAD